MERKGPYRIQSTSNLIGRSASPWGSVAETSAARFHEVEFTRSTRYAPQPPQAADFARASGIPPTDLNSSFPGSNGSRSFSFGPSPPTQDSRTQKIPSSGQTFAPFAGSEPHVSNISSNPFASPFWKLSSESNPMQSLSPTGRGPSGIADSPLGIDRQHKHNDSQSPASHSNLSNSTFDSPVQVHDLRGRRARVGVNGVRLSNMMLDEFPDQLITMSVIEELDLSNNKIRNLPHTITNLTRLRILDLSVNTLPGVSSLQQLYSLVAINLSRNRLSQLPGGMSNLTRLEELDVRENHISSLEPALSEMPSSLRLLDMKGNHISSIPESISKLVLLQELYFSDNQVTSIPEGLSHLNKLMIFDIGSNRISSIPVHVASISSLVQVTFDNNQISHIPREIGSMRNLSKLSVLNNPLEKLIAELSKQGTFSLLRYLRSSSEGLHGEDSAEAIRGRIFDQEKMISEMRHKYQSDLNSLQDRLKLSEFEKHSEITKNATLSARIAELESLLSGFDTQAVAQLKSANQELLHDKEKLQIELVEKERQYNEASARKNDLLTEAIKKIEDLVKRLQETEEENRLLVAEKNGFISHLETQLALAREGSEKSKLEMIFKGVRESSLQLRTCLNRIQGIGQQMNAIVFRMEFNDQSATLAYRAIQPPSGNVTLVCVELFCPMLSWDENPRLYAKAISKLNTKLRAKMESLNGYEVFTVGHVNLVAFSRPIDAIRWGLSCHENAQSLRMSEVVEPHDKHKYVPEMLEYQAIHFKISAHEGKPEVLHNIVANRFDYLGPDVQLVFTMASVCHPGQFLVTQGTLTSLTPSESDGIFEAYAMQTCHFPGIDVEIHPVCVHSFGQQFEPFPDIEPQNCFPSAAQQIIITLRSAQEEYTTLLRAVEQLEVDLANLLLAGLDSGSLQLQYEEKVAALVSRQQDLTQKFAAIITHQQDLRKILATIEMDRLQPIMSERDNLAERLSNMQSFVATISQATEPITSTAQPFLDRHESELTDESLSLDGSISSGVESDASKQSKDEAPRKLSIPNVEPISQLVQKVKGGRFRNLDEANSFLRSLVDQLPNKDSLLLDSASSLLSPTSARDRKSITSRSTPSSTSTSTSTTASASTSTTRRGRTTTTTPATTSSSSGVVQGRSSSKPPVPKMSGTTK
eukprot:TRINITY_DN3001_c0_g1_i4.p1 TRINITY_DN3001_c0_g1~~TRINITY_DN3001_c0_g1_i4.p1  ORF type:complete len:1153 (+),score=210.04 TRINITY_DN3001_c0_g1_i4:71-3529(+)